MLHRNADGSSESYVSVKRDDLRRILAENRLKHEAAFQAAMEGYKKTCIIKLEERLAAARDGKIVDIRVPLTEPTHHLKDYDRVLKMLELSTEEVWQISEDQFGNYVMDEWSWTTHFSVTNAAYSGG